MRNFWSFKYPMFTFKMKHPVREHLCMYIHTRYGWPVTLFQNSSSRSSLLSLNNANFYSQSRFVGMESSSSVPSTVETCIWTFWDRTRWICLFVSTFRRNLVSTTLRIEVNVNRVKERIESLCIFTAFFFFFKYRLKFVQFAIINHQIIVNNFLWYFDW